MNRKNIKIIVLMMTILIILLVNPSAFGISIEKSDEFTVTLEYLGLPLHDGAEIPASALLNARYDFEALPSAEYIMTLPTPLTAVQTGSFDVVARDGGGNRIVIGEAVVDENLEIAVSILDEIGGSTEQESLPDPKPMPEQELLPEPEPVAITGSVTFEIPCAFDLTGIPLQQGAMSRTVRLESGGRMITVNVLAGIQPMDAMMSPFATTFAADLSTLMTILDVTLKRSGTEVANDAMIGFGEMLELTYAFEITPSQGDAILDALSVDPNTAYEIPIPDGLSWPQTVNKKELKAGTETFAEIWASDGKAYIKFTGAFWEGTPVPGSLFIDAGWLSMNCLLDQDKIGTKKDYDIMLIGGKTVKVLIADNQASKHTLIKSGNYANNRFDWMAKYIPGDEGAAYPLTLVDTFDNAVHILVPDTLKINGVPYTTNSGITITHEAGKTTISYEVTEANKNKPITFTYQTRLADSLLKSDNPTDETKASNTLALLDKNKAAVVPAVTRDVTVDAESKRWMGKTGAQTGRSVEWTVNINTLDRDLKDLVMYDKTPAWLMTPSSVIVRTKDGAVVASGYAFSTAPADQKEGSTFSVKFTDTPYPSDGYTVTYSTNIESEYFDDPSKTREPNAAWLTYDWRDYQYDGGKGGTYAAIKRLPPSVDTGFTGNTNVIKKRALGYNSSTHEITWEVTVNPYGVDISLGAITDDLTSRKQEYVGGSLSANSFITTANVDGNKELTFNVGSLGTTTTTYTFKTRVTEKDDYAGNQSGKPYENKVDFSGTLSPSGTITDSALANITVTSTMLTKRSVAYNYDTGEVTWELTANANKMPMTSPVIVDTLSAGQSYVDGSITGAVSATQAGTQLTITLASTSESVIVTYRTKVNVDSIDNFKKNTQVVVTNSAVLSHDGYNGLASATSSRTIGNNFLNKRGTYADGVVSFAVDININAITIPGSVTLTDKLGTGLRLDVTSLKLWKATVDSSGTFSTTSALYTYADRIGGVSTGALVFDYTRLLNDNEFSFTLPSDTGRYILMYDCFVTGSSYENDVALSGNAAIDPFAKNYGSSIGAGGGGSSSKYATLEVEKVDSRRTGVKLDGVGFGLYQRFPEGVIDDMLIATATTSSLGIAKFSPLGLNTTYVLKEITPKDGYDKDTLATNAAVSFVSKDGCAGNELLITVTGNGTYAFVATNVPASTEHNSSNGIEFTKQSDQVSAGAFVPWTSITDKAKFRITDKNYPTFYMETETGTDGAVRFTDVPFGTYTLSEVKTPAYHQTMTPFDITVAIDGSVTTPVSGDFNLGGAMAYVNNVYFRPTLTIQKANIGGAASLSGIEFGLYEVTGGGIEILLSTGTMDNSGKVTFTAKQSGVTELLYGGRDYVIKEITSLGGYYTTGVHRINDVKTAGPITVNWNNYAHAASLVITKVDSKRPGVPLQGAEFKLYTTKIDADNNQNAIATGTTDSTGKTTFAGLSLKQNQTSLTIAAEPMLLSTSYWIREITAPAGYTAVSTGSIEVVLDPAQAGSENARTYTYTTDVSNTPVSANFSFIKYSQMKDESHQVPLQGAEFTIRDQSTGSGFFMTAESGADGLVSFTDVPFGTYLVEETKVPDNHTKYRDFDVTIDKDGKITKFDKQNNPSGLTGHFGVVNIVSLTSLEIICTSSGGAMGDVPFTLYRERAAGDWELVGTTTNTGIDGKVIFDDLHVGETYKIVETAPDGYYQPQEYVFTAEDNTAHKFEWINYQIDGAITVTKTDAVSGMILSGVRYGLSAPGVPTKDAITSVGGIASFTGLPLEFTYSMSSGSGIYSAVFSAKTYTVQELASIEGYVRDTTGHSITLEPGTKIKSLSLTNEPKKADIRFLKVNPWNRQLQGAEFMLTGQALSNGYQFTAAAISSANGEVIFSGVPFGTYKIQETKAPVDHERNTQIFDIEIGKNGAFITSMPTTVVNEFDSFSVRIIKTEGDTSTPVTGVAFEIFDSRGVGRGTATTDTNGVATFAGLMVNEEYEIRETTPLGYYPSAPEKITSSSANKDTTFDVLWKNYPGEGEVKLTLTDKNTKKPVAGVEFGIYINDNSGNLLLVGKATSNSSGELIFSGLPLSTTTEATPGTAPTLDPLVTTAYTIKQISTVSGYTPVTDFDVKVPNATPVADQTVAIAPVSTRPGGGGGSGGGGSQTLPEKGPEAEPPANTEAQTPANVDVTPGPTIEPGNAAEGQVPQIGAPKPEDIVQADDVPVLSALTEDEILHPELLPEGYSAVHLRDNIYVIYDEHDMPIGYITLPENTALNAYSILENIKSFDEVSSHKSNPKTGNRDEQEFSWYVLLLVLLMAGSGILVTKRRRTN